MTKHTKIIIFLAAALVGIALYAFWPKPTKTNPVKTVVSWIVDPILGEAKTGVVVRLDADTLYPYKKWEPLYFGPMWRYDTVKRKGLTDTVTSKLVWYQISKKAIVHDYDKHYELEGN